MARCHLHTRIIYSDNTEAEGLKYSAAAAELVLNALAARFRLTECE